MSDESLRHGAVPSTESAALRESWGWMLAVGLIWILLGTVAIVVPFAATLALELMLGAIFAVGGIAQIIQAFRSRGWRGFAFHLVGGFLALILGALLLFYPLQGAVTLTLFLAAFFLVQGIVKIAAALQNRSTRSWGWLLFSGILGVVVALLIWLGLPSSAVWAIGLLVGVELIFTGWSLVMLALAARSA